MAGLNAFPNRPCSWVVMEGVVDPGGLCLGLRDVLDGKEIVRVSQCLVHHILLGAAVHRIWDEV